MPEFAAQATGGTAPSLPLADVIDAALASRSLQDATGPGLANTLNSPWTAHRDQHRGEQWKSRQCQVQRLTILSLQSTGNRR